MINEIKDRLSEVLSVAEGCFKKDGYEVKTELEVSDIEQGYNTYIFPTMQVTADAEDEADLVFGFTVEIDKDGNCNDAELNSDIDEFINKARKYADLIDNADNKSDAIAELDRQAREEVANAIKAEAERTAERESAAIKATYRQALLAGGVMAAVALIFFIISKLF